VFSIRYNSVIESYHGRRQSIPPQLGSYSIITVPTGESRRPRRRLANCVKLKTTRRRRMGWGRWRGSIQTTVGGRVRRSVVSLRRTAYGATSSVTSVDSGLLPAAAAAAAAAVQWACNTASPLASQLTAVSSCLLLPPTASQLLRFDVSAGKRRIIAE